MGTARLWAERSTCSRLHVGAVVARDGRILVTGYNGAPAGMPHCNHECTCGVRGEHHFASCSSKKPCVDSVHAEANAVAYAARHGISLQDTAIFTTHSPCLNCCMLIVNAGIKAVVWEIDFRDLSGLKVLEQGKVAFGRYRPDHAQTDIMVE